MPQKVLVIDDEPELIELYKTRLGANGFDVETASDGVEGVNKAMTVMPDVILLDVVMPRMDGYEVCMKLKADPKTKAIPIIVVTASSEEDIASRFKKLGASDCITRPHDSKDLIEKINAVL